MNDYKESNEKILLIAIFILSFSIGIWTNYRNLWLESKNMSISDISILLSISFICSSIIILLISFFSSKIKIKNLVIEVIIIRIISLIVLKYTSNTFLLIFFFITSLSCELIFMISSYPLCSFINDGDRLYRRKVIIEYISNDLAIIICALLFGRTIGLLFVNYDTFLSFSFIFSLISLFLFIIYKDNNKNNTNNNFIVSIKEIFNIKSNRIYLISSFFVRISYSMIFDLIMIIFINKLNISILNTSIFIIISNMIGNILCIYLNSISDKISIKNSILIKYGIRCIFYILAFILNNNYIFLLCIFISYITSKILDNKVCGVFIRQNDNKNKFLFENIRYFIECFASSIGAYLAGILLNINLGILFLVSSFITIIQIIILNYNIKFIKKY